MSAALLVGAVLWAATQATIGVLPYLQRHPDMIDNVNTEA